MPVPGELFQDDLKWHNNQLPVMNLIKGEEGERRSRQEPENSACLIKRKIDFFPSKTKSEPVQIYVIPPSLWRLLSKDTLNICLGLFSYTIFLFSNLEVKSWPRIHF